jgi:hypothetical protein
LQLSRGLAKIAETTAGTKKALEPA